MEQSKGSKTGIFYSLKKRFWSNSLTKKSCFKNRGSKLKLHSESSHCNLFSSVGDNCTGNGSETRSVRPNLKNTFSTSEPTIAKSVLKSNLNEQTSSTTEALTITDQEITDRGRTSVEEYCRDEFISGVNNPRVLHSTNSVAVHSSRLNEHTLRLGDNAHDAHSENNIGDENEVSNIKSGLMCELLKLSKHGWYWGSITKEEAEEKLTDQPDGAFLLRDSSADHFILSLSFRSFGKTLHTRIEYNLSRGLFSFYQQSEESFASIAELIEHSMSFSKSAVYCYSRPRSPGHPAFPVRLTKPVSRFAHVRSLQHLCRFVIRESIRLDNIQKLPLPPSIKGYIEEGHY